MADSLFSPVVGTTMCAIALLSLAAVLIIQYLFFADGGLLSLGCNIFNMGVIPRPVVYPLYKPLIKNGITVKRITAASIISVVKKKQSEIQNT